MRRRRYVGVDIQPQGLTVAALQRERSALRLAGAKFVSLEGVFDFTSRQPNIRETRRFVEGLRQGVEQVAGAEERIALSLPDRIGRLFLSEIDAPVKSYQEGVEILKWKHKSILPLPPGQMRIDYQVLEKRDEGRQRCIVAAIAAPLLEQYEDLVNEAGCHAVVVDFHSLCVYNYYRPSLDLGDEFILVSLEKGAISIQYFLGRTLSYQRTRAMKVDPEKTFREVNRSLIEAYESYPSMQRCPVFAHVDRDFEGAMEEVLKASFEREVKYLDPLMRRVAGMEKGGGMDGDGSFVAALGSAERLL